MAGFPTSASRVPRATTQSDRLDTSTRQLRASAVSWKATLAAGPTSIQSIIEGIFQAFIAEKAVLVEGRDTEGVLDAHGDNLLMRVRLFAADVNDTNDRFVVDHLFQKGDPIRVRPIGDSVLPAPLAAATNYWATVITAGGFKIASSLVNANADTAINLTTAGTGEFLVTYRLLANLNQAITELDDVLTWIDDNVPKTTTTNEVRAYTLDKTATSGEGAVVAKTLTSVQTAGLQTALQALIDEIEAPA